MVADPSSSHPPAGCRSPEELVREIARNGPAVVALSGGVDSSVVAALAFRALGPRVEAVTLTGAAVSSHELERARSVAHHIGIAHAVVPADPLEVLEYRQNPSNRCFFCRRTESAAIRSWASGRPFSQFLDGVHSDDLGDDRPGLAAMNQAGFGHPLVWAGWGKVAVRAFARSIGLPNWDEPSNACLASRVAYGRPISAELLGRIERAEAQVRSLGFRRVRVRTDGASARVEVDAGEVARLLEPATARSIADRLRLSGFDEVTLDPVGYRAREPR